jgi:hypothetical protein
VVRMGFSRVAAILVVAGLALSSGCKEKAGLKLRTDTEPLTRRLKIPASAITSARWVAVSPVQDSGWVPPQADFYDVYAYITLDPSAWSGVDALASRGSSPETLEIPQPVGAVMFAGNFPAALKKLGEVSVAEGTAIDPERLTENDKTEVSKAVRVENALVLLMRVR